MNSKKVLIERNSYQCQDPLEIILLRWVVDEDEYICVGFDKYEKVIQQKCISSSTCNCLNDSSWVSTDEIRRGAFIESGSSYCGYEPIGPERIYRWSVIGEPECYGTDRYINEIKEYSDDNGENWERVEPEETRKVIVERNSKYCQVAPPQESYFRWVMSGTECIGYSKYEILAQQKCISSETCSCVETEPITSTCWVNTGITKRGNLLEENSKDCGYINSIYRWVYAVIPENGKCTCSGKTITFEIGTVCVDNDLYRYSKKQVSTDSGETWSDVIEYSYSCITCGYVGEYEDVFDRCPVCGSKNKVNLDDGHIVYRLQERIEENSPQCLTDVCSFVLNTDAERVFFYMDSSTEYLICEKEVENEKAELTKEEVRVLTDSLGIDFLLEVYAKPYKDGYTYNPTVVKIECNGEANAYHNSCDITPSNGTCGCSGGTVTFTI